MPEAEVDEVAPWEFRLAHLLPIPAFATGIVIALLLLAAFLVFSWASGLPVSAPGAALTDAARDSLYISLLVGYAFAALRLGASGIERDLVRAGVEARAEPGGFRFPREVVRRSRYVGVIGIAWGVLLIQVTAKLQGFAMRAPWTGLHEASFMMWALLLLFWLIARAAVFTIHGSLVAGDATTEEIEIDLLHLQPLDAFGRIGLRFALLWIVGLTIAAPLLLGPELELTPLLVGLAIVGSIATTALMIPVRDIRSRIRAAKQAELVQIAAAIAGDEAAVAKTRIAQRRHAPSLADLIAYRGLVESAREWPYDTPTISRFALYLLIPLASWVAAAFVERALDAVLG